MNSCNIADIINGSCCSWYENYYNPYTEDIGYVSDRFTSKGLVVEAAWRNLGVVKNIKANRNSYLSGNIIDKTSVI